MHKNVSGQKIGIELINAADGSAFTGSATCYVTGDAGIQAVHRTAQMADKSPLVARQAETIPDAPPPAD